MTNNPIINELEQQIRCISHEIRNNLSICDMYTQIIKRNLEKEGINNDSINNALACIQKSVQIIGANLMDLKSINSNSFRIFDFKNVILRAVEMSKAYVEDKNIEFDVFVKNSANISIDECKFISCIVNIIKNGIEAIDIKGKICVYGEILNKNAVIKISNNGRPISKEKQSKIFEVGFTTKQTGSGLGLDICNKYLKTQNATLILSKSTKTETQFVITMPCC